MSTHSFSLNNYKEKSSVNIEKKCYERLNFKFFQNHLTLTIYSQTILNIFYHSNSISRRYLKILAVL